MSGIAAGSLPLRFHEDCNTIAADSSPVHPTGSFVAAVSSSGVLVSQFATLRRFEGNDPLR
jgi:hypothetical protein